jgi:hypothetical protein
MRDTQWARSRGNRSERAGLRRGAWYRVVEDDGKPWVVLDVHRVEVRIPREDLELRGERPGTWSVVHEPHLVCPGCHERRHVAGEPKEVTCPECSHTYPVDWKDRA